MKTQGTVKELSSCTLVRKVYLNASTCTRKPTQDHLPVYLFADTGHQPLKQLTPLDMTMIV